MTHDNPGTVKQVWVVVIQAYNRQTVARIEADSEQEAIKKAHAKIGYRVKAEPARGESTT